jgi:signal transduction histidine kinase
LRNTFVLLTAGALLLFGIPLAIAVQRVVEGDALARLQRDAARAVAAVPDEALDTTRALELPELPDGVRLSLYDRQGQRRAGAGPMRSELAAAVVDGKEHHGHESGELVVVAPIVSDTVVTGSVRTAMPLGDLTTDRLQAWVALSGLGILVLAFSALLAGRAARRIARPFEELTVGAKALGDGLFEIDLPRWGLREADAAAAALQRTAQEMGQLVTQERDFVRHANHQLRTPLAGLTLQLEELAGSGTEPRVSAALERANQLDRTLQDLLVVRSPVQGATCDADELVSELVLRWSGTTPRPITVRSAEVDAVAMPEAAVRQALEVLLDNAVRHGAGPITVTVEPLGDLVLVEVSDDGEGFGTGALNGTGLRLATGLMQRFGGELLIRRRAPRPRVALLLPQSSSSNR